MLVGILLTVLDILLIGWELFVEGIRQTEEGNHRIVGELFEGNHQTEGGTPLIVLPILLTLLLPLFHMSF